MAAGGTGGHLLPGVALGHVLRARGHDVHFVIKSDEQSALLLRESSFASSAYYFEGAPRRLSWKWATYPFVAAAALASARRVLRREQPNVVVGMGGYVSVPLGFWAVSTGTPLVLHEQNARAGLANRLLAPWAVSVGTSFEKTERLDRAHTVWTGLPLRADVVPRDPREARRTLGLKEEAYTVLVFGGSQGARSLNRKVWEALPMMTAAGAPGQFIHLTGAADEAAGRSVYAQDGRPHFVRGFSPDIATAYAAADVVVARAGANTVMELFRLGKPALLVPYPFAADDHQTANARFLEEQGQARVVQEKDLTPAALAEFLVQCAEKRPRPWGGASDKDRAGATGKAAAERLADVVESAGEA